MNSNIQNSSTPIKNNINSSNNTKKNSFKNAALESMLLTLKSDNPFKNIKPSNEKNNFINIDNNNNNNKYEEQENDLTTKLLKEEYPQIFNNKIKSPKEFNLNKNINFSNGKNALNYIENLIEKKEHKDFIENDLLKNLNILKWFKCYKLLTGNNPQSLSVILGKFKSNYAYNSNNNQSTLFEVKDVIIFDCIQVINCIDINLNVKNIILIKNTNSKYDNVDNIINDYFLKKGNLFLCKCNKEEKKNFIKVFINDIQILA